MIQLTCVLLDFTAIHIQLYYQLNVQMALSQLLVHQTFLIVQIAQLATIVWMAVLKNMIVLSVIIAPQELEIQYHALRELIMDI